jgi:hypothetical protein
MPVSLTGNGDEKKKDDKPNLKTIRASLPLNVTIYQQGFYDGVL